ncbi:MAG: hypothetical protein K8I82_05590, partial [Anaerolineae bacterium]|nr:hypothetical protein [Anaerolineae bacterium]
MEQEVGLYPQHTVEVIQHTSRRQIVITVGMALATVFIANFLTYYVPMDRTETVVYQKWGLIQDLDAPVDWLIVGDSSANHGVIPAIITQELGGEALNVATFGDWLFVDDAWMIETHIRQVGAPKNIIIVHVPDMYHRTMEANV